MILWGGRGEGVREHFSCREHFVREGSISGSILLNVHPATSPSRSEFMKRSAPPKGGLRVGLLMITGGYSPEVTRFFSRY